MKREDYKDEVIKGKSLCGFCSTGSHATCKGGIRNGNGTVIVCGCECAADKPQWCHICHSTDEFDLTRPWLCGDVDECNARLTKRLLSDPIYVEITKFQSQAVDIRRIKSGRTAGACLCCGEATRGGKFLPGHDSRFLAAKLAEVHAGKVTSADQIKVVADVSPALATKFEKRLKGEFA